MNHQKTSGINQFLGMIIIALIFSSVSSEAQTPQAFKYQAAIRDAAGTPIGNTYVGIRISILKSYPDAEPVFVETHHLITSSTGLVAINIGDGNLQSGNFTAINWGTSVYFVRVEVDANGGSDFLLMGVSQLLSVPYSLYSQQSTASEGLIVYDWEQLMTDYPQPAVGMMVYVSDREKIAFYNGTGWMLINPCPPATFANAGNDVTMACSPFQLSANSPGSGNTGVWSMISGSGGSISDLDNPQGLLYGLPGETYILAWTISNVCDQSSDTISVFFDHLPSYALAGPDQLNVNGTSVVLQGNDPEFGIGQWSIISGSGGSFADPMLHNTLFYGQPGESYVLAWTITNACGEFTKNNTNVSFCYTLVQANAGGNAENVCPPYQLQANEPGTGNIGSWEIYSGNGGSLNDHLNPQAILSGLPGESYTLVWKIENVCGYTSDTITVFFDPLPSISYAGPDQTDVPGNVVQLEGNQPETGTGVWSIASGEGGNFDDPSLFNTYFTGQRGNSYLLVWSITNLCSETFSDTVLISLCPVLTSAYAGQNETEACSPFLLGANDPGSGNSGVWEIISGTGGNVDNVSDPQALLTGSYGEVYTLLWTIFNNCDTSSSTVTIAFEQLPTQPDAGPDQNLLNYNTVVLAANVPDYGDAWWEIVSGENGYFIDSTQHNTTFTGELGQVYILTWNIANNCGFILSDTLMVSCCNELCIPDAGQDVVDVCSPYQLNGNEPDAGNFGLWTIINGEGGSLTNPESPQAELTGLPGGAYSLTWTLTNGCASLSDTLSVVFMAPPTQPVAGPDQFIVNGTGTLLAANFPDFGTASWTIVSGEQGVISDPLVNTSSFAGLLGETYELAWNITNACGVTLSDYVTISFCYEVGTAHAGNNTENVCNPHQLNATQPQTGNTGLWSIISGEGGDISNLQDPQAVLTGVPGETYQLVWALFTDCESSTDTITISFEPMPATAEAGQDQLSLVDATTILNGNQPATGSGLWTIVIGENGLLADPQVHNTTFTGLPGAAYTLAWTISNLCGESSSDTVFISFCYAMPQADAGQDVANVCSPYQLGANLPGTGNTGLWGIFSGTGGLIDGPSNPQAWLSGEIGETYVLTWTIINDCGHSSSDTVTIVFESDATQADAGPDQLDVFGNSATMSANTPVSGSGLWSVISGTGGNFTIHSDPTTEFVGLEGETYELEWRISNNCFETADTVIIGFQQGFLCGDTLIDSRDGKAYPTVQIGTQCWMARNLNVGNQIFTGTNPTNNGIIEKYCFNNIAANCDTYGGLYFFDELVDYDISTPGTTGLCPQGWHVPTETEFSALINYLDGSDLAGGKLKETGNDYWTDNVGATNESGFSAYGAGYLGGSFLALNVDGRFWTSNRSGSNAAHVRLRASTTTVSVAYTPRNSGMSARCIKD